MSKRRVPGNDSQNDTIPANTVASSARTEAGDERSAKGEPPERVIPGKRLKWGWVAALFLCILVLAGFAFLARSGKPQPGADKKGGGAAARSVPVAAVPAKKGDVGVYLAGLGSVTPNNTVTVRSRVDGQLMEFLFREGQSRPERPASRADRPSAVRDPAGPGRRAAGPRPGAPEKRRARPCALPHPAPAGFDRKPADRHPGSAGPAIRRHRQIGPGAGRKRQAAVGLLPHHRADRRPGRADGSWTRGT